MYSLLVYLVYVDVPLYVNILLYVEETRILKHYTVKNEQLNNILLPTLFAVVKNNVQHCYTRLRLNNIVSYC